MLSNGAGAALKTEPMVWLGSYPTHASEWFFQKPGVQPLFQANAGVAIARVNTRVEKDKYDSGLAGQRVLPS